MGLHTGEAAERDGDYFGPAVNLAARVADTGHGGQIVATGEVLEARNLISRDGLYWLFETLVDNFIGFAPLGVLLHLWITCSAARVVLQLLGERSHRFLARERNGEAERCPAAGRLDDVDAAVMGPRDAAHDGEAES